MAHRLILVVLLAFLAACGDMDSSTTDQSVASSSGSAVSISASSSSSLTSSSFSSQQSSVALSSSSESLSSSSSASSTGLFTDPDLNAYYASALERDGEALKTALHAIVKTATFLTYSQVYELITQTDKDLTNRDDDYVVLFYSQRSVLAEEKCHTTATDCWNREHLWPKSLGVGYDDTLACYTDLFHLRPADAQVNMDRSNRRFGEASTPYADIDGVFYDDASWSWEPSDERKGDVARALLYMTVRYEGENGEPDLELLPYDESTERPADLCTMLEWNRLDPVSSAEQRRNSTVYGYQANRNPFIDHASWADDIYAAQCTP